MGSISIQGKLMQKIHREPTAIQGNAKHTVGFELS